MEYLWTAFGGAESRGRANTLKLLLLLSCLEVARPLDNTDLSITNTCLLENI